MADPPAAGEKSFGILARKVGPLPVAAWATIAVGGYLLARHFNLFGLGSSSTPAAPATPATSATPANTGQGNKIVAKIMGTPPSSNSGTAGTVTSTSTTPASTTSGAASSSTPATSSSSSTPGIGILGQTPTGTYNRKSKSGTGRATSVGTSAAQEQASAPSVYAAAPSANGAAPQTAQATSASVPAVVYEGPVYGLWTSEQQGLGAMSGQGGVSIDQTVNNPAATPVAPPPPPPPTTPPPKKKDNDGGGGGSTQPGPNPTGKTLSDALSSSNIIHVSYAYVAVPQSQWASYGSHTIASSTATGGGWDVGLN